MMYAHMCVCARACVCVCTCMPRVWEMVRTGGFRVMTMRVPTENKGQYNGCM